MAAPPIKPMKSRRLMPASQGFQTMMLPNEGVGLKAVMSALGHKQTCALQSVMSALHPIATAKAKFRKRPCPLYPRKRTLAGVNQLLSANGGLPLLAGCTIGRYRVGKSGVHAHPTSPCCSTWFEHGLSDNSDDLKNRNESEHHGGVFRTDRPRIRQLGNGDLASGCRHQTSPRARASCRLRRADAG